MEDFSLTEYVVHVAKERCEQKHIDVHDAKICVGEGSQRGFSPPCDECLTEVRTELQRKRGKAHGQVLTQAEAEEVRKMLGIE